MSSYSSAARNSRRPGAGSSGSSSTSRPVHARQHSANTAGDVFAMLGKPTSKERDERERESSRARQDSKESDRAAENTPSSPSGSTNSLSTPSSSFDNGRDAVRLAKSPSPARYKKLYTKPRLLGLWSKDRSLEVSLAHIFSSMEAPDKYTGIEEIAPTQRFYQAGHGRRVNSGEHSSGAGALGRLPTGERVSPTAYTNPHSASARRGERYGQIGIQGGVLSGVGSAGQPRHASNRDEEDAEFERAPLGRGVNRTASHNTAVKDEKEKGPQAGGPAWTSNRWRHLQTEDESQSGSTSGTSSRENELEDPIKPPGSDSQSAAWVPPAEDKIKAERPKLFQDALDGMSAAASQDQNVQQPASGSAGTAGFGSQRNAALRGTPSKNPLWTDDLLSPALSSGSRGSGGPSFPSEPHPIAHAVALAPNPSAAAVTNTLSRLTLNKEALLGNNATRRPSETMTPTRLQASEGLDILARRSPVQELSMAQLQQQGFMQHQQQQQQYAQQPYTAVAPSPIPRMPNPESIFWQYKDPQGNIQGPFSAIQMQDWYLQGFFNETLLVRRVEAQDFETLGALVIRIGDASKPFLSSPAPRMYGPPGMFGIGQPVSISPVANRVASPSLWSQGHSHTSSAIPQSISQSSSRHASFSGNLGSYPDVFAPSAVSQPNYSHIHAPQPQSGSVSTPLDPWADTLPQSPAISRSTSQHAFDSVPAPAHQEVAPIAPIGRSQSAVNNANTASPIVKTPGPPQPIAATSNKEKETNGAQPEAPSASATPAGDKPEALDKAPALKAESKAESKNPAPSQSDSSSSAAKAEVLAKATTESTSQTTVPQPPKPISSGQADALRRAAVTQSSSTGSSDDKAKATRSSVSGKVQVSAQEAFDKQKAAGQAPAAQTSEYPFPISSTTESATSSPAAPKTAPWVKGPADTSAANAATATSKPALSLKEIQAKEAQQAIARKAAEKRALAAQLAAEEAALADKTAREQAESLPSKSTWGTGAPVASPASSALTSSPWAKANSSPAAPAIVAQQKKKTMKEILEEEEMRKKKAAAAASNPVLPGKGYAGSISGVKNGPSPAATSGGAWTTVGATKPATSVASPAVRTPAVPSPGKPISVSATPSSSAASVRPSASVSPISTSLKTVPNGRSATPVPKSEDTSIPASPDLIKWCKEALKGLEIPIDDFIHMLLSFPVPIDKSTRELISDSVYASSRTLDGRHFADAFADKRQADAKAIKAGKVIPAAHVAPAQKPVSFTDAIKFVPNKPVEPNFKIVTKKQTKGKK